MTLLFTWRPVAFLGQQYIIVLPICRIDGSEWPLLKGALSFINHDLVLCEVFLKEPLSGLSLQLLWMTYLASLMAATPSSMLEGSSLGR